MLFAKLGVCKNRKLYFLKLRFHQIYLNFSFFAIDFQIKNFPVIYRISNGNKSR
jgi:hypothetical protein